MNSVSIFRLVYGGTDAKTDTGREHPKTQKIKSTQIFSQDNTTHAHIFESTPTSPSLFLSKQRTNR